MLAVLWHLLGVSTCGSLHKVLINPGKFFQPESDLKPKGKWQCKGEAHPEQQKAKKEVTGTHETLRKLLDREGDHKTWGLPAVYNYHKQLFFNGKLYSTTLDREN